ncbi:SagB-type dehydrogenase family enzyme [Kitasatospora sp. GAS204A]|uniref:SagB family peptide dehydrogenase n=1 Tax=unclassified Kitasatospora TaxID=2633591 RepID=UPI002474A15C|nr:SagB family peptide dehydrogenase [Kitasatospora sp. GAS204B]MDH6119752.1 SagB-type dehydrogenase family enzyme [Kitasatospora sp. GAS204B]
MSYAHLYATAVMRRGRVPMEPADFVPNWQDRPRKGKFFPHAEHFPLPTGHTQAAATTQRGLTGPRGDGTFDLALLGAMLQDSYGLTGRRLAVQANSDLPALPHYTQANWSRGTASGGGLYPIGIHWISGPATPLTPGVYHYATGHHTMQRLLTGDVSAQVRAAVGDDALLGDTDQFLILGVNFWQNAFKYNSFSYHVVTMDIGALLQTWRIWARAHGLHISAALWFDEERLGRLLGFQPEQEGVFAVVPLPWQPAATGAPTPPAGPADTAAPARVRIADEERSQRVLTFKTVQRVHAATARHSARRPAPAALAAALTSSAPARTVAKKVLLPRPQPLATGIGQALRARRSSFGRFSAQPPLRAEQLSTVLAATASAAHLDSDVELPDGPALTRLYVFANHVDDVPAGTYAYDHEAGSLELISTEAPGAFLQEAYFLSNYNLEQAGAVIMVAAPTHAVLDAVGDRGLRLVNAAVGAASQAFYTSSAAAGLGCGVALGFDCVAYAEKLGLAETGEVPLLIMMVGHERPHPADFQYQIV